MRERRAREVSSEDTNLGTILCPEDGYSWTTLPGLDGRIPIAKYIPNSVASQHSSLGFQEAALCVQSHLI